MQALPDLFSLEVSHLQRAENDGDGLVNDLVYSQGHFTT